MLVHTALLQSSRDGIRRRRCLGSSGSGSAQVPQAQVLGSVADRMDGRLLACRQNPGFAEQRLICVVTLLYLTYSMSSPPRRSWQAAMAPSRAHRSGQEPLG